MKKQHKDRRRLAGLLSASMVFTLMPSMAFGAVKPAIPPMDDAVLMESPGGDTGKTYTGQALTGEFGYYSKVIVEVDSEDTIVSVKDNETKPAADSQVFWNKILENDLFSKYKGLKFSEIKSLKDSIDSVTGATVSSDAVFEAVCNAAGEETGSDAFEIDEHGVLTEYLKDEEAVTVPEGVLEIDEYAFSAKENVKKVIIPASVEYINTSAFLNCPNLSGFEVSADNKNFYSANGILFKKDGDALFLFPCGIQGDFTVPEGVKEIGDGAFFSSSLTTLKISASVEKIGTGIIDFAENLKAINVDENNKHFSAYDEILFNKKQDALILVPTGISGEHVIPDTVKSLGEGAFYSCAKLTKITLPEGLEEIPMLAFAGCASLKEVVMPESLKAIGDRAFAGCQAMTTFTVPANVSDFGTYVFTNSANISEILVAEGNKNFTSVDGVLFSADKKTLVQYPLGRAGDYTVPDGTDRLDVGSFFSANLLEKVTVPDSVTVFGNGGDTPLDTLVFGFPGGYPANLVLAANKDSAAAQYAEVMAIPFEESAEADKFLAQLIGDYQPLFDGATLNSAYDHYWHDYISAVVGESAADDMAAYMKSSVNAKGYGENNEAPNFYCGFTNDVETITFGGEDGTTVTYKKKDGSSVTHTYSFVKEADATGKYGDYNMAMSGRLYKAQEAAEDEFQYLLMFPDTPDTTYHLEFRYAGTEADVLNLLEGPYAYWVGSAIRTSALTEENEETLQKVISLFVVENLAGNETDETNAQRQGLAGTWDCDFSAFPEYGNAKMYITLSEDGTGKTYADFTGSGEPALTAEYTFYAYDPDKTDGKNGGTYIALNPSAETVTPGAYEIKQIEGKKALVFTSNEGVITYFLRNDASRFKDVDDGKWYYEGIDYAVKNGMMNGVAGDMFAPEGITTRAMIVTILYRLEGEPAAKASAFRDLQAGSWYEAAVNWAAENDIVNGYNGSTFAPNDEITREQMAAILYRYAGFKGIDVSKAAALTSYTDAGSVSSWAKDAMAWAVDIQLIKGMTENTIVPQGKTTRAQAATLMMRLCENVLK